MKNLLFIVLGLISLSFTIFSCSPDNTKEEIEEVTETITLDMGIVDDQGIVSVQKVVIDPSQGTSQVARPRNNKKQKVTGDFQYASGTTYQVAAIENNGGVHGEMEVQKSTGAITKWETICVCTEGNEGITGSIVTEIVVPGFLELNYISFSKFIDNGEGNNHPKDQTGSLLYYYYNWFNSYDSAEAFLEDINCGNFEEFTGLNFGSRIEIESGNIQVQ